MIHCHLLPHMVWGMQTVSSMSLRTITIVKGTVLTQLLLQAWVMGNQAQVLGLIDRPGVEGYLTYGGSVVGNATNPPDVIDFFSLDEWDNTWNSTGKKSQ